MDDAPIFAWFEPARGPEDLPGVRLAYIDPIRTYFDRALEAANKAMDTPRALNILHQRTFYEQKGQTYFTPDFGWWMKEADYYNGRGGFGGVTKEQIEERNPTIVIVSSHDEAKEKAEEMGLLDNPCQV